MSKNDETRVIVEGRLISDFNGFDENMTFEFQNGQVWQQAVYKYRYHYAYMPHAKVIETNEGKILVVDGMSDTVKVSRIH